MRRPLELSLVALLAVFLLVKSPSFTQSVETQGGVSDGRAAAQEAFQRLNNRIFTKTDVQWEPQDGETSDAAPDATWHFDAQTWQTTEVTVYSALGEVTRRHSLDSLPAGLHRVVVYNLTTSLVLGSVQVTGLGEGTIIDVTEGSTDLPQEVKSQEEQVIDGLKEEVEACERSYSFAQDQLKMSKFNIDTVSGMISNLKPENLAVLSSAGFESLDALLKYRENLFHSAYETRQSADHAVKSAWKKLKDKRAQLETAQTAYSRLVNSFQVSILLRVASNEPLDLQLSYQVNGVSWEPSYDARATSDLGSVLIVYSGKVWQETGEDWLDVRMALSTAEPGVGGDPPDLPRHTLSFRPPPPRMFKQNAKRKGRARSDAVLAYRASPLSFMADEDAEEELMDSMSYAEAMPMRMAKEGLATATSSALGGAVPPRVELESNQAAEVVSSLTSATFVVPHRTTLKSSSGYGSHKVGIVTLPFEPVWEYKVVPRGRENAYLTMNCTNDSKYTLLPGQIKVYLDGTFVTTSNLQITPPGGSLHLSFGIDEGIQVKTEPDRVEEGRTGIVFMEKNSRTVIHSYRITNTKDRTISVTVEDRLPLSEDKDIRVSVDSHTEKTARNGAASLKFSKEDPDKVKWQMTMPPGGEQALQMDVVIEWPKSKQVYGLPKPHG